LIKNLNDFQQIEDLADEFQGHDISTPQAIEQRDQELFI